MHENQITALGDLTIIVSFMHSMSTSIAATPISRKSGLLYVSRMTDLDTEIDHQKVSKSTAVIECLLRQSIHVTQIYGAR